MRPATGRKPRAGSESYTFFFQAEDGIRDKLVTGVQTCALPICRAGAADHRQLRCAGMGRYRDGAATVQPGKGKGETGNRSWHSAGPRCEPGRRRRADRVSLLRAGATHHGGDSECEWGKRAVWVIPMRNAEWGMRSVRGRSLAERRSVLNSAFRILHSALCTK